MKRKAGWLRMKFASSSLLVRVILALGVVALVPLLVVSLPLIHLNREAMTTQVLRSHAIAARATAARIAARVSSLQTLVRSSATDRELLEAQRSQAGRRILSGLVLSRSDIVAAAVTDSEGHEAVRAQRKRYGHVISTLLGRAPSPLPSIVTAGRGIWLCLDEPLPGGSGWLRVIAKGDALAAALKPEELGPSAKMAVVTTAHRVLLPAGKTLQGFPKTQIDAALTGKVSGSGRYSSGRSTVLGAFAPIPGTNWVVLSREPAAVAEATARRMRRQALGAVLLAMLLAGALAGISYRSLVKPLRSLLAMQRRISGLEGNAAVPGNEMTALKESLETLRQRVADKEALQDVFLGRFQVHEVLGEGAMGTVFRGWDPKLERPVALKTIRLAKLASPEEGTARSLHQEAIAAARISSPHIVAVYDVVIQEDLGFIAMEYVDGPSLHQHMFHKGPLPPSSAAPLGAAIASALASAHKAGLVHHDVKPGNVLLGYDGSIKVTDFGIARFVTSATDETELVFGTPGYMPPEALHGEGYDELGDVFALGATLYQCLSGRLPFLGSTLKETIEKTLFEAPPSIARLNPAVPQDLATIVDRLVAPRAQRTRSAAEAAQHLDELCGLYGWRWKAPEPLKVKSRKEDPHATPQHSCIVRTVPDMPTLPSGTRSGQTTLTYPNNDRGRS